MNVIKCLLYNGSHAATDDVSGTLAALNTPEFNVKQSPTINADSLNGIDVLLIPGGDGGETYLECGDFNQTDIQNFIFNGGKGYFVCAGSYDAAKKVIGVKNYTGWGVAPTVIANTLTDNEPDGLLVKFLEDVLGVNGDLTVKHYQGPYFTDPTNTMTIFAVFDDNQTGHKGAAAIVGEKYGKGYSILSSVHPENSESTYFLVQNLVKLAYNGGVNISDANVDNIQNYQISKNDFELMIAAVADYEKEYQGKLPVEVYIRKDGVKQANYITWNKYQSLLTIWNAFEKANNRVPNYIYINSPTTPVKTPAPEPIGYTRVAPYDYYAQFNDYVCGDASWMMALSTFDIYPLNNSEQDCLNDPEAAELIVAGISGTQMNDNGTSHAGMLAVAAHYDLQAKFVSFAGLGIQGLADAIAAGKVPIVNIMIANGTNWAFPQYIPSIAEGHYIFIVGVDVATLTITVADPDRNIETIPYSEVGMGASLITEDSLLLIWK